MDKKFIAVITLLLLVCFLFLACSEYYPGTEVSEQIEGSTELDNIGAAYVERFFQKDKVIDIQITLAEADYEDMLQNATAEEYKEAEVLVDGVKVEHVGFRVKGNSSLSSVARSDSNRYSFKLDFNQYLDQQSLEGLTKLNLNNSFSDPSYMREYLSYSLLKEMV